MNSSFQMPIICPDTPRTSSEIQIVESTVPFSELSVGEKCMLIVPVTILIIFTILIGNFFKFIVQMIVEYFKNKYFNR